MGPADRVVADGDSTEPVDFQRLRFEYRRSAEQNGAPSVRHPVVVVGAGPVGLTLAIDLAQKGVPVVVLDSDCALATESRAICSAKRTLKVLDRLGCGEPMVAKGVSWNVGKVFFREAQIYSFNLLTEAGHERPAFINLQQYYVEGFLGERAAALPLIDLRWMNSVVGVEQRSDHVVLTVDTPDGRYELTCEWVAACDGSRSTVRELIGEQSKGRVFRDRFLIADVRIKLERPAERWFWFDPKFHPNQSVLLHMQPDGVWRIDFQLGWDADPLEEKKAHNIIPRVKALLGESIAFELEWASVYTFACQRMDRFRHGRVVFAGDSAHGVSPFGARGANSGVQDAENLAWKLAMVVQGQAPDELIDTYATEREYAADENIRHSTRATDFITPKSEISRTFRDAVLILARQHPFARTLVNSGRLSTPTILLGSPLCTPDSAEFDSSMVPGAAAADAPVTLTENCNTFNKCDALDVRDGWLLRHIKGTFTLLVYGPEVAECIKQFAANTERQAMVSVVHVLPRGYAAAWGERMTTLVDRDGCVARRYDMLPGTVYLLRPDQHVCARWRQPATEDLHRALRRATALTGDDCK